MDHGFRTMVHDAALSKWPAFLIFLTILTFEKGGYFARAFLEK